MQKKNENKELRAYRMGPLTMLQLMIVLAVLGVLLTWVLRQFLFS